MLLDVVDAQGKQITEEVFEGTKPTDRYSKLKWPRQPVTTTKQQKLWKAALEAAFTLSGRSLQQPLGKWTGPPTQVWRSFYNPRTKRVVTSMTGTTIQFTEHVVSTRKRYRVDATPVAMASPYESLEDVDWNIMIPVTVKQMQTRNIVASFHETAEEIQEARPATTFSDYIATLLQHIRRLLMHYEFTLGGEQILKACLEQNMILKLGTNGSYNMGKETASFGWLLIGNQNVLIRGAGPIDGVPTVLSSTRAELFGIAAPNEFLFHL
jgi:hypothetical protein